jgi:hypothetical protein
MDDPHAALHLGFGGEAATAFTHWRERRIRRSGFGRRDNDVGRAWRAILSGIVTPLLTKASPKWFTPCSNYLCQLPPIVTTGKLR